MQKKVYNVKLFDFKHGSQVRVYNKPISRIIKDRNDLDTKAYEIEPDGQVKLKDPKMKKKKALQKQKEPLD